MTPRAELPSEISTIMFIDIVGYTTTTARLTREQFSELHDVFDSISLPIFDKHAGKVIKKIGDAFLITFKSATNAVLCGMELQNAFELYSKHATRPIKIRVAIHTGEVLYRNNDVFGDTVNTAARIETAAGPGEIVFSESVHSAMNKNEIESIHLGMKSFKGLKSPMRLFRVKNKYDDVIKMRRKIKRFFKTIIFIAIVAGLIFAALKYLVFNPELPALLAEYGLQ